jgi:hypothetical protein
MKENKVKTYVRGLGLVLALILLGIVGFIALGLITLSIFIVLGIIFIGIAIVALLLTPYYFAKEHEVKSKNFKLKKVKKKEKI